MAQWSQLFLMAALLFIYLYNIRMLPLGGDARATIVAYANLEVPLRGRDAGRAVVDLGHRDAGLFVDAHGGRPDVDLRARAAVGPETIAGGERTIGYSLVPAVVACG